MADNISNEYNMTKILQEIGSNFFPNDLSEQRVGMFGFLSESMARLFGSVILDSNMRANEYHTITAKKMDTLLYDASILGVEVENTNPAEMIAYLAFDISSIHRNEFSNIEDNPNDGNKTYYFVIERDTNINIAGFNFMLEWDILVTANYSDTAKEYIYSARYLTEGDEDPHNNDNCSGRVYIKEDTLSTLTDKYIQGNVVKSDTGSLFMMRVNLRQMEKKYEYYVVSETDQISLTGLEFQYDDYLSHFNVYFRENQSSNWEYVHPISIYDTSEYTEKTIQYQVDKDAKVIILNATEFDVKYNSEFRIDIFTTKGSSGNITYNGDGGDIVCELKSYDGNHIYNGIDMICTPVTSAQYGKDPSTIEDVRGKVIRAKGSKNGLSTEYDLYNYVKERDMINDYFFLKKRSDILEHIYGTFTILRTVNGDIIPSTTLNLIIKKENDPKNGLYFEDRLLTIKSGTPFRNVINLLGEKDDEGNVILSESDSKLLEIVHENFQSDGSLDKFLSTIYNRVDENGNILSNSEVAKKESSMKLYGLPYTMVYDTLNQLTSLYLTSISRSVDMSATSINDELEYEANFVIDHINISRNSFVGDDSYKIQVSVMANADYSNCVLGEYVNSGVTENSLMLKGFVYNKDVSDMTSDTGKEYPYAFFDFDFISFNNGIFTFETSIKIDDSLSMTYDNMKINSPDFMYIINSLRIANSDNMTSGTLHLKNIVPNPSCSIDVFNIKIGLAVYYLAAPVNERTGVPSIQLSKDSDGEYILGNSGYPDPILNVYGYPEFENSVDNDSEVIPYIMTNLYVNSSDLIDFYIDMSYVVRATTDFVEVDGSNYIYFRDIPLLQYSKAIDDEISNRVTNIISDTKKYLDEINMRLDDSFSLDYKFFRTYGPCQYFKLEKTDSTVQEVLENLDITLELNARLKSGITATDSDIISRLRTFLKSYVEKLNDQDDDYTIYMSNITTELENNFSDVLKSIDLVNLNGKGDRYRVVFYDKPNLDTYHAQLNGRQLIKNYVPEYINLPLENITINIIR